MKRNLSLILITIILLVFTGCNIVFEETKSNKADITSIVAEQILGSAVINSDEKRVELTIEPMDLSELDLNIEISPGATISTTELIDGEEVIFSVTAENGEKTNWTILATISFGMSFDMNDEHIFYDCGFISGDPVENINVGDNTPCVFESNKGVKVFKFFSVEESLNVDPIQVPDNALVLQTTAITEGTYDDTGGHAGVGGIKDGKELNDGPYEITIETTGDVGQTLTGQFSAVVATEGDPPGTPGTTYNITKGYFKVKRIAEENIF